ncbi:hypothetical protein WN944_021235 [Citrus x changshan-huyou]|uniref:Uncharacterized protein n=1 Tax=Citrus x changshan-huyou TaxID=2935761 RepID=A0AAP0R2L6_9ROSI
MKSGVEALAGGKEVMTWQISGSASKVVAGDQLVCGTDLLSESRWVDWEDLISSDTVPLVGFVRMVPSFQKFRKMESRLISRIGNV